MQYFNANVVYIVMMAEKILSPLIANARFALFMYLLGLISLMVIHAGGRHVSVFELVVDVYALCLLLYFLPARITKWVRGVFYVIAYGLAIVDMYCNERLGAPINASFVRICTETSQREAVEALASYVTWQSLTVPLLLILLLMVVQIATSKWKPKINFKLSRIASWIGVGFLLFCLAVSVKNKIFIFRNLTEPKSGLELEYASEIPHSGGFYLPFYRVLYAWKGISLERESIRKLERNIDRIRVDSCTFQSPNIVLIIGEAYSRQHSQLYGYAKPTTPKQMQLAKDSSLIVFTDVVSPYHQTSMVFRMAFSLYAYGQPGDWTDYPLFPQLFKKAGYQVSFITNQFVPSMAQDVFDFSGSVFLNTPALSRSLFTHRNTRIHEFDMGLLEDYDSLRAYQQDHNLIIFHLLGQHAGYAGRYPVQEHRFTPKDYQNRKDLSADDLLELSHYDNACLYNDKVVAEIINRFKEQDAIVIYMPDHGEMCFDYGSDIYGRTLSVQTNAEIKQQFEIPFWIWTSARYRQQHPALYEQIKSSSHRPFMTDNISHLLLYLAGISCKDYRDADNLLSPRYHSGRERMLMGEIDYDSMR